MGLAQSLCLLLILFCRCAKNSYFCIPLRRKGFDLKDGIGGYWGRIYFKINIAQEKKIATFASRFGGGEKGIVRLNI
jgi:hypothetical protein